MLYSWPLNGIKIPLPGRRSPAHKIMSLSSSGLMPPGSHGWDDELEFNTQFSSQWDSLVHVQHQPSGLAYNGIKPTQEGLASPQTTAENGQPTIDHWHARGGLVGRGVLIDFKAYMESQSKPYHSLDGYRITVEDVEEVARHQGVEFRHGDILIIRTGVTEICKRHPAVLRTGPAISVLNEPMARVASGIPTPRGRINHQTLQI